MKYRIRLINIMIILMMFLCVLLFIIACIFEKGATKIMMNK